MKKNLWIPLLIIMLFGSLFAATGKLNVFTGDNAISIIVDGDVVGQGDLRKYKIDEGKHYLQLKKKGKILKAKVFMIDAGRTETIVEDQFVDYKTNIASRGALDVEAMRVRETRGNFAFGVHAFSPAAGLSLKWMFSERLGIQGIGFVNNFDGNIDSRGGARLLFNLNDSVYQGSVMSYYIALGTGKAMIRNTIEAEKDERYDVSELSFGIEFKLANIFGNENRQESRHIVIDGEDDPMNALMSIFCLNMGESFMKFAHVSIEFGVERVLTIYNDPSLDYNSKERVAGKISGGFHFYF